MDNKQAKEDTYIKKDNNWRHTYRRAHTKKDIQRKTDTQTEKDGQEDPNIWTE